MRRNAIFALIFAIAAACAPATAPAAPTHPLDPLDADEIAAAVAVLGASGRVDRSTMAVGVSLSPPPKQSVLDWRDGDPIPRRAFAVLRVKGETVEAEIDLDAGTLARWTVVEGVESAILSAEWSMAEAALKADPRWRSAMLARGFESYDGILCEALSAGYLGRPEEEGRRLARMPCYDVRGLRSNIYAKPIEGVVGAVDLETREVLSVIDAGIVPRRDEAHEFEGEPRREAAAPTAAIAMQGRRVAWGPWQLHLGFDQRFGPVISTVTFEDGGAARPVLYRGHVSEVFVPYMDPGEAWAFRTYLDAGEFGLGALTYPLSPGLDCPEDAHYVDAAIASPDGRARVRRGVVCVFERDLAGPLWRHTEAYNGASEARRATELVVRSVASIAHYDYVFDWVFAASGEIAVNVGATGIDSVKGVAADSMADPGAAAATATGALVAPGLVAVNHDHFFSIRLDLDVDGPVNRFVRERLTPTPAPEGSGRRSFWRVVEDPVRREGAVSEDGAPQVWSVAHAGKLTPLGRAPAYQIVAGGARSMLDPEGWPRRRAAFSGEHLWVTARRDGENFAAGAYPNQSPGGGGLPEYVNGESVDGADLVAWATIGFHHVTRPEDWPVLSTLWRGIRLRPYGFFVRNPSAPAPR